MSSILLIIILSFSLCSQAQPPAFLQLTGDVPVTDTVAVKDSFPAIDSSLRFINLNPWLFYNTEVIPSKINTGLTGMLDVSECESIAFLVQCQSCTFTFESILFNSNIPLKHYQAVIICGDEFRWTPEFDFVKETDSAKTKILVLTNDTAIVKIAVRNALDYSLAKQEYDQVRQTVQTYNLQLKYSFLQLDKKMGKLKGTRLAFDLTSASTGLTATIENTSSSENAQKTSKALPGIGLALTPVNEATAANKPVEQNQAATRLTYIKRLDYMLQDNQLVSQKDEDIHRKTQKLKDELKQVQAQMIDIPVKVTTDMSEEDLNTYFNSAKVNKKYRLKRR